MALQNAHPSFPRMDWKHKKENALPPHSECLNFPSILSVTRICCHFSLSFAPPHLPMLQSVSAITMLCRLLWHRLGQLTGFGSCEGRKRMSRQAETRQREKIGRWLSLSLPPQSHMFEWEEGFSRWIAEGSSVFAVRNVQPAFNAFYQVDNCWYKSLSLQIKRGFLTPL